MIANLAGFLPKTGKQEVRPPQLAASFISRRRNVDVWHVSDVPLLPTKVLTQMPESHFSPAGIPLAGQIPLITYADCFISALGPL
jgi:hypothetical protein